MRSFTTIPKSTSTPPPASPLLHPSRDTFCNVAPSLAPTWLTAKEPGDRDRHEQETDRVAAEETSTQTPCVDHDFSKIRIFPPTAQIQTKLTVNQPGDKYEQEADRIAEEVTRMPGFAGGAMPAGGPPDIQKKCAACASGSGMCRKCAEEEEQKLQRKPLASSITPLVQREQAQTGDDKDDEEELLQTKNLSSQNSPITPDLNARVQALTSRGGMPLPDTEQAFFEPRLGFDFSQVRVFNDARAAELARGLSARAFTVGSNIAFGAGQYMPETGNGRRLIAHELTHVVQQNGVVTNVQRPLSFLVGQTRIQRTLGDGHDLTSPRFSRLLDLESAYDDETVIRKGSKGRGVQAIQQALYDLGYPLPASGADGDFGDETELAVKAFQRDQHPPLTDDGKVGKNTMAALDARFGAVVLPVPAARTAPWDADSPSYDCVRSILCPWSPHTIDVLRTRITLKSFDDISWADEKWDGAAWVVDPFPGDGYNTGTEIGVFNSSCEEMAETLYHEVLHAEQPTIHGTTRKKESYAYRIGEEFSIAMGLAGDPSLRSTDPQGRQFADRAKVEAFVAAEYPGVSTGSPGDEIIGKAVIHGHVRVERPNGSIYTRPAAVGEKVPGPMTTINEVTHPTVGWTCP